MLLRAKADLAMDVVNLKISKLGGLTKIRQARDLCVSMGIAMTLEDSWGGDIATAAIAHLAHSTPEEFRFTSTDFNSYVTVSTADGAPQRVNGFMSASTAPGLGITPKMDVLGKPRGRRRITHHHETAHTHPYPQHRRASHHRVRRAAGNQTPRRQAADMTKPVQVFILLGQSNMVGLGKVGGGEMVAGACGEGEEEISLPAWMMRARGWSGRTCAMPA